MSSRRFMIKGRAIRDGYASFDGDLFNHIVRVLRLTTGTAVILVDEHGTEHAGILDQINRDWVMVKIVSSGSKPPSEPTAPAITVFQALPKGDKIELILQKGTELGVHDFTVFGGKRSVARISEEKQEAKLSRWQRIATEAARQCHRRDVPSVSWAENARMACSSIGHDLRILLWEGEKKQGLKLLLNNRPKPESVCIAIGPEGGLEQAEAELFVGHGFQPVTLGERILRTETAALATVSILQYIWDDI